MMLTKTVETRLNEVLLLHGIVAQILYQMISNHKPTFIGKFVTAISHDRNVIADGCGVVDLTTFWLLLGNFLVKLLHQTNVFIFACKC